jgi:phosphoribosylaminoimidazole-succinocarboxamide synthase
MSGLRHLYSGKVRDIYDAGDHRLLMVTSDRMSAFDVVMNEPIPSKGRVLTAMTAFWLEHLRGVAGSHVISTDLDDLPEEARRPEWEGRVMLCHRAEMLLVECIVRGYLSGSAWKEYKATGTMHGTKLPSGLQESDQLPEPVFTPSTKAEQGLHDENISFQQAVDLVGQDAATRARDISLELYRRGSERAAERGIIIADTKFELGFVPASSSCATRCSLRIRRASGPRTSGSRASRPRRSTSNHCATTSTASSGTRPRRPHRSPTTS